MEPAPDFKRLFEATAGLSLLLSAELRIAAVTEGYARATKLRPEDLTGKLLSDAILVAADAPVSAVLRENLPSFDRVLRERRKDVVCVQTHGHRDAGQCAGTDDRHWRCENTPVIAADGSVAWIIHHIEDVTHAVQQERNAAELRARVDELQDADRTRQAVLDALSVCIAVLDEDGCILNVNDRWRKFASQNPASIMTPCEGTNFLGFCAASLAEERYARALTQGVNDVFAERIGEFTSDYPCFTGREERWFAVRVALLPGDGPRRAILSFKDNTQRVHAELELRESEKRERDRANELTALLDAVPAPVFIASDPECVHITGNRAADDLLRLPRGAEASLTAPSDAKPRHFKVLREGRELSGEELPAQRAARGFQVEDFEEVIEFDDGTRRDMLAYATPLLDDAGKPRGSILVLVDITARKMAELALRESEEQYRRLVQALPAAFYTCDAEGLIRIYNSAAVALWGREPVVGEDRWCGSYRLFTAKAEHLPVAECPGATAIMTAKPVRDVEIIVERPDGTRSEVLAFADPIWDLNGTLTGVVNVLVDITALRVAEHALRTSERTLRMLSCAVEQSPASVVITNTAGDIDYVNAKFTEVTGYSLAEVVGKNPRLLKSGHQPEELYRDMWSTILAGRVWRGELCNRKKSGEQYWEFAVIAPIQDQTGKVTHFVAVKEDITDRKQAEKALVESQERFAGIVTSAMDAIISIDEAQRIILFNAAAERMFRCAAEEALGASVDRFIPSRFTAAHREHIRSFSRTESTGRAMGHLGALSGRRSTGEEFPIEASISTTEAGGEKIYTVILRDVTERKRLEKEVIEISAREQRRIGRDLHDDLCQWLAGTEYLASALAEDLATRSPADAARVQKIAAAMRQANARARMLAHGLAPAVIESAGLTGALRDLAASSGEMFGIHCVYDGPEMVPVQDSVAALHLYRIAQEAISNAVRHGGAREVRIIVQLNPDHVMMMIRDDGCGIPDPLPDTGGMGLGTMRYRAGTIGAALKIGRGKDGGTEVICSVPRNV